MGNRFILIMSKHIKLFKDGYDPEVETLHLYENRPFVGYSETDEKVIYTEDIPYFYVESLVDDNTAGISYAMANYILNDYVYLEVSTDKKNWLNVKNLLLLEEADTESGYIIPTYDAGCVEG